MFTAYDVHQLATGEHKEFPFGIGPERAAKELHMFADKIASGEYLLQVVETNYKVTHDDFPMSHLHIEFYEKATYEGNKDV